jgi:hypothetical protein
VSAVSALPYRGADCRRPLMPACEVTLGGYIAKSMLSLPRMIVDANVLSDVGELSGMKKY